MFVCLFNVISINTSLQVPTVVDRTMPIQEQLTPNLYLLGQIVAKELGLARYLLLFLFGVFL